jgi:hypothetical protein
MVDIFMMITEALHDLHDHNKNKKYQASMPARIELRAGIVFAARVFASQ